MLWQWLTKMILNQMAEDFVGFGGAMAPVA
jgi:hypothetical protein